jgi:hypothetical protein
MMIKETAIVTSFLPVGTQVMGSLFQAARSRPILLREGASRSAFSRFCELRSSTRLKDSTVSFRTVAPRWQNSELWFKRRSAC